MVAATSSVIFLKTRGNKMRAIASTDAVGNPLIGDVPMTGLTISSTTGRNRHRKIDIWTRPLDYRGKGVLDDLIDDKFYGVLADRLARDWGIPLDTPVEFGRAARGGLKIVICISKGIKCAHYQKKIYPKRLK